MKKQTLLVYLVPALMLFFFVRNVVLVKTDHMDSWMGGGMRMFGKIDKMLYRVSGFTFNHNGNSHFVNLRKVPELYDEDVKARILPSDGRLEEILDVIKSSTWYYNPMKGTIQKNKEKGCIHLFPEAITGFEVYAIQYENDTKTISLNQLHQLQNQ